MTMPNMNVVYAPVPLCQTRMRRLNNFAKDDPSYWPQPFHCSIAHLSVIPVPSDLPTHPLHPAWYQPLASDFVPVNNDGLEGNGQLAVEVQNNVTALCQRLLQDMAELLE
jgi:hypothetical protein